MGYGAMIKKMAVLVLLALLSASVFALGNCTLYGTLHKAGCASFTKSASCENGFSTALNCGQKTCNWAGGCTAGAQSCQWGTKKSIANCGVLPKNITICRQYCDLSGTTQCNPCDVIGACTAIKAGNCYIPEFAGIEFNEIQLSTGLIALLAAIGLPLALFRKKR